MDAVILAGGRAARLGGADKPGLIVGASSMAAAAARAAAAAGAQQVIMVGPDRADLATVRAALPGGLLIAREDPPGSGPVPALRAGLSLVRAPWVAVLAADLPFLRAAPLRELLRAAGSSAAGAVMIDDAGAAQWLLGCWRTTRLRSALAAYRGKSLRGLLDPLGPALVSGRGRAGEPPPWADCDTPDDLAAARRWERVPPPDELSADA